MQQTIVLIALLAVLGWFVLTLPRRQDKKRMRRIEAQLEPGAEVITTGGIIGTVRDVSEAQVVALEVADGVVIRVFRRGISGVLPHDVAGAAGTLPTDTEPPTAAPEPAEHS